MGKWQLWGDSDVPLLEGKESEVRKYIEQLHPDDAEAKEVYIQSPTGDEEVYDWETKTWSKM